MIGRPDSNGLNQARNYVASLRSPGGRAGARSKSVPYRVIIQRPKAQIAVRARTRARNPASYTPRRRLAEDDGLRAKEAPAAGTDSRARAGLNRENNSTSHHGGQEARRTPRSCCECRRGMRDPAPNAKPRHSCGLLRRRLRAARTGAPQRRRAARRAYRNRTITQAKTPHRPPPRSPRPSVPVMRTAAGSSRSSRAIRPRPGP